MSIHGYVGNIITANPTAPTSTVASGVWTTEQQLAAKSAGNWPFTIPTQQIGSSLRFNSADSAYLSRTPASAGNRRTWTWSCWIKGSAATSSMFSASNGSAGALYTRFGGNGAGIDIGQYNTVADFSLYTNAVTRDYSAWYHIVISADTTQATSTNRIKIYINSVEQTSLVGTYPTQNQDTFINSTNAHAVGRFENVGQYLNGYMTEVNFIDGQALTPSSFGRTSTTTGVWEPIAYTGTYGTNGFYLNFSDNSNTTAATLGKDSSSNGNNWTPNNFSVTAGAGNDSLVDSPTAYGTDTGVGGEVRGNYATWNPLATTPAAPVTFSNGNLDVSFGSSLTGRTQSTLGVSSGKWYAEITVTAASGTDRIIGIVTPTTNNQPGYTADSYGYYGNGQKITNDTLTSYGASYTANDVIGIALDLDAGTITFYKNNTSQGQAFSGLSGTYLISVSDSSNAGTCSYTANFGQRAFAYTAPSGFKALCTTNLPTPTIGATSTTQANKYFDATTYTGNGSSQSIVNSGGFQPDFVWYKSRSSGAFNHGLFDVIRGTSKQLFSNSTSAEGTFSGVTAFNSNGFSVGSDNGGNENGGSMVAWQWNAGGSTVTNTSGTISAQVRASTISGVSIITYTGNGTAGATVGHGLGTTPSMIIVKSRSIGTSDWVVWHTALTSSNNNYLVLNQTAAVNTANQPWNNTLPTSSVFSLRTWDGVNQSSATYVAYLFSAVAGYSAFGSYTGNGSTDGPFVYTGFRPKYVLVKRTNTTGNWQVFDGARDTYNFVDLRLQPNLSNAEATGTTSALYFADFLSNGFKIVGTDTDWNASSSTYIYAAFAESPFKYSLAR